MRRSFLISLILGIAVICYTNEAVAQTDPSERIRGFDDDPKPEIENISGSRPKPGYTFGLTAPIISSDEEGSGTDVNDEDAGKDLDNLMIKVTSLDYTGIKVFPNPVSDVLCVNLGMEIDVRISLMNILGQEVRLESREVNKVYFDVTQLDPGIYFVYIETTDKKVVRKVKVNH